MCKRDLLVIIRNKSRGVESFILFLVEIGPLEVTEIVLWVISCVFLGIVGLLFFIDSRKIQNKFYLWISLFFFFFIPARIFRIFVRFVYGEPPIG